MTRSKELLVCLDQGTCVRVERQRYVYYAKLHTEGLQNRNALIIISYSVPCPLLNAHFPLNSFVRSLTHGSSSN